MGDRDRCEMCGEIHLGMFNGWHDERGDHTGHVCYRCETEFNRKVESNTTELRWL